MSDRDDRIEAATTAWRPRANGRIEVLPAWHDLDEAGRVTAFEETLVLRRMEAAMDPSGASTTVRAVLARILQST